MRGKFPKVLFNQGSQKFEALDPKEDNLVNSIYNSPDPTNAVKKLVRDTAPPDDIKPFNNFDKSTYPSNPEVRKKLFSDTLENPEIKRIAKRFVDRKNTPKKQIDFTELDKQIKTIHEDLNTYEQRIKKQKEDNEFIEKIRKQIKEPSQPQPKGLEQAYVSDEVYLRRKGL
jgi:hypothetical protein